MEKEKINYLPAAGAFALMMAMSLCTTALSFFNEPVSAELGVGRGSFTLYYSLLMATGAFSSPLVGQFVGKFGVRPVVGLSAVWCFLGFMLFSCSGSLWAFYLIAVCMGVLCVSCVSLCANVTVQTMYPTQKAAGMLGIVMSGSGVGGMIASLILPGILENYGWRIGYRMLAMLWLTLVILAFAAIGKPHHNEKSRTVKTAQGGMTRAEAIRSRQLYCVIGMGLLLSAACGITTQIPSVLTSIGYTASQAGMLMSLMTAAIACGKIIQGVIYGNLGLTKGGILTIGLFVISFWMLTIKALTIPALVFMAMGVGVVTTLLPLNAKAIFGTREYAAIYGIISLGATCGNFVAAPVWGSVYDVFGSYVPGLLFTPFLLIAALGLHILLNRKRT